jgi:hypothetical protein
MTKREAYPQGYKSAPKQPFDLKKWKDTAVKAKIAAREYKEYTEEQLVNHLTQKWDLQERESFKDWLKYQTKRGRQDMSMQKTAYDYNSANQEEQLNELKKKLRSRVSSAERLLNRMLDEGLLAGNDDKALYIGRILQKLKEEINLLKRPQIMQARHQRAGNIFRKAGLVELADIMVGSISVIGSFGKKEMVKTAAEGADLSGAMEMIKDELDIFNYGVHLDKMMKIRGELLADGRNSEADTILEIIKKELDDIDGIHKKLVEIYTSLGQVPRQRKQVSKPVEPRMEPRVKMPREPRMEAPMEPAPRNIPAPRGPEVPNLPR